MHASLVSNDSSQWKRKQLVLSIRYKMNERGLKKVFTFLCWSFQQPVGQTMFREGWFLERSLASWRCYISQHVNTLFLKLSLHSLNAPDLRRRWHTWSPCCGQRLSSWIPQPLNHKATRRKTKQQKTKKGRGGGWGLDLFVTSLLEQCSVSSLLVRALFCCCLSCQSIWRNQGLEAKTFQA